MNYLRFGGAERVKSLIIVRARGGGGSNLAPWRRETKVIGKMRRRRRSRGELVVSIRKRDPVCFGSFWVYEYRKQR